MGRGAKDGAGRAPDPDTIAVYDARAEEYATRLGREGVDPELAAFMACLAPGARVLDLGCGPGRSAHLMKRAGFEVDALDASQGMVDLARSRYGLAARLGTFADLDPPYGGVWASFSLLHMPRADLPAYLVRLGEALLPGGALHIALKSGAGEGRDSLGRFYAYHDAGEVADWLREAGFSPDPPLTGTDPGLAGPAEAWFAILARKEEGR